MNFQLGLYKYFLIMRILLFLSILAMLSSCKNQYIENESKKLDSMINLMSQLQIKVNSINLDSAKVKLELIKTNEKYFFENNVDLSKDSILMKEMMTYGRIHKSYKKFIKENENLLKEAQYSYTQLNDLKKDFVDKKIENEVYLKYLAEEDSALIKVSEKINFYIEDIESADKFFYEVNPKIENYIKQGVK